MIGVTAAAIGFFIMLALMLAGLHVAVALFLVATLGALLYMGPPIVLSFGNNMWSILNDFILTAIPMFVLLGEILMRSGVTDRMYKALSDWLGYLPGGLLHSNIGASAMFAAISGSSVATAATIGTVALPSLRKRRYNEALVLGSVAAGGTLGILIPPSVNMIIYGAITDTSIGSLFIAAIVPGVLLTVLFMAMIVVLCVIRPSLAGVADTRDPLSVRLKNLVGLVPPLIVFLVVMGSIYLGWATPTEAAALGVVIALLIAASYCRLTFSLLHEAFLATARTTAMVMLIITAAFFLNFVIGLLGIPQVMTEFVTSLGTSPVATIWILVLFYLILGCFLETLSMMIATVPVVVPMVVALGFDPIWFGIVLVVLMELSLITPPVGMNLYVVQGVRGRGSIVDVMIGIVPFIAMMMFLVTLLIYFPGIALWLLA